MAGLTWHADLNINEPSTKKAKHTPCYTMTPALISINTPSHKRNPVKMFSRELDYDIHLYSEHLSSTLTGISHLFLNQLAVDKFT
ncbi:unnamed protein product [Heterobilharzia americana]|nr:unnamed protein product [Heterobilharzia americana]CAH8589729.1 unnamed protein product [Heterobilharzia americana]